MEQYLSEEASAIARETYKLTVVSPMAMHGADSKGDAEFRTASFKGILRYWWRSLQVDPNRQSLLTREVQLFGGTETEEKRKSPVSFFLSEPLKGIRQENVLPHRTKSDNDPKRGPVISKTIEINKTIVLNMQTSKKNKEALTNYKNSLHYMLHLTGMGQRARRGFGACQWEKHEWETPQEFAQSLRKTLGTLGVEQQFDWYEEGSCLLQRKSAAKVKHPVLKAVYIGEGKSTMREILTDFGRASHLGNPNGNLGSASPRWASPLWCTIRKIGNLHYPIITEMQTDESKIRNKSVYASDRAKFLEEAGVKL